MSSSMYFQPRRLTIILLMAYRNQISSFEIWKLKFSCSKRGCYKKLFLLILVAVSWCKVQKIENNAKWWLGASRHSRFVPSFIVPYCTIWKRCLGPWHNSKKHSVRIYPVFYQAEDSESFIDLKALASSKRLSPRNDFFRCSAPLQTTPEISAMWICGWQLGMAFSFHSYSYKFTAPHVCFYLHTNSGKRHFRIRIEILATMVCKTTSGKNQENERE